MRFIKVHLVLKPREEAQHDDLEDNRPIRGRLFSNSAEEVKILENSQAPAKVLDLHRLLLDRESPVEFSITEPEQSSMFQIDAKTGIVQNLKVIMNVAHLSRSFLQAT